MFAGGEEEDGLPLEKWILSYDGCSW